MLKKILPLLVLLVVGCGGSSGGSNVNNPFAGTWAGSWVLSDGSASGTSVVTIAGDGTTTGATEQTAPFSVPNGSISGHVDNNGNISGSYSYPGQGTYGFSGTLSFGGAGLIGNFQQQTAGGTVTTIFNLQRL